MPPILSDYTFAFGDSGTVLNTDSMSFPFIDVTQVSGLDTAPLRETTDERQGMDGTYIDTPHMSARTVVINGTLYTVPSDPDTLLLTLRRDYNSDSVRPFYFQLPGQPIRFVNGQGGGLQYDIDTNRRSGKTPVQFTVLCGDPYIYDWPTQQSSVQLTPTSGVGMFFNMSFPLGFGGAIPNSTMTVRNGGTHTAYPVVTLFGPLVNPVLTDAFGISMMFNINLQASDALVVDCRNRSVILNGTINRRQALQGLSWFSVPAGATESIVLSGSGTGFATTQLNNTYY